MIDPDRVAESALGNLARIDQHIDTVNALKKGGKLQCVDGVVQRVKRGIWETITRKKSDPIENLRCFETIERDLAESVEQLRTILADPGTDERVKKQIKLALSVILAKYDPRAMDGIKKDFEKAFEKLATKHELNPEAVRQYLLEGKTESFLEGFQGKARTSTESALAALKISAPASRIAESRTVKNFLGIRTGGSISAIHQTLLDAGDQLLRERASSSQESTHSLESHTFRTIHPTQERASNATEFAEEDIHAAIATEPVQENFPPPPLAPPPPDSDPRAYANKAEQERKAAVGKLEGKVDELQEAIAHASDTAKSLFTDQLSAKEMVRTLERQVRDNAHFESYSEALRTIAQASSELTSRLGERGIFEKDNEPRAKLLKDFIASGKEILNVEVQKVIQDPATKEEITVSKEVSIKRSEAETMLETEYRKPLQELEEAIEGLKRSISRKEQTLEENQNRLIDGKPFSKLANQYNEGLSRLNSLKKKWEEAGRVLNNLKEQLAETEIILNKTKEKLRAPSSTKSQIKSDTVARSYETNEAIQKVLNRRGIIHLPDLSLQGRVSYEDAPHQTENVENQANGTTPPKKEAASKSRVRRFFEKLLG